MNNGFYFLAGMTCAAASGAKTRGEILGGIAICGILLVFILVIGLVGYAICWWLERR